MTAFTRIQAEKKARESRMREFGDGEVTIEEIYEHALPDADPKLIEAFVANEVEAEQQCLFIFRPMLDLMRLAKQAGLKVVIASDMYIRRPHLKDMIDSSLKKIGESFELDAWYTSSELRRTKYQGLHEIIAMDLKVRPEQIIHLGDNAHADYFGARASGVEGYYFQRFGSLLEDRLRLNHSAQLMLMDGHEYRRSMACTFHPVWAMLPPASNLQELMGWYYLGPILAHFIRGLQSHIRSVYDPRRKTRIVFMMRDGYMPMQAYKLFRQHGFNLPNTSVHSIDVSRRAVICLSIRSKEDLRKTFNQLARLIYPVEILRQLCTPFEPEDFFELKSINPEISLEDLETLVMESEFTEKIIQNADSQRNRLKKYIEKQVAIEAGDQVVLVDLGYSGTIQDHLGPLIEEAFSVNVDGYYLILRDTDRSPDRKYGFISTRDISSKSVDLLLSQIQSLEQFSCNGNGSVKGFGKKGDPIYENNLIDPRQIELKDQVQMASSDFLLAAIKAYMDLPLTRAEILQDTIGLIARFTLHPTKDELELYKFFSHDINNGTNRKRFISNIELTKDALIRGGLMTFDAEYHKMFANDLIAFNPAFASYGWSKFRFAQKNNFSEFEDNTIQLQAVISTLDEFREKTARVYCTHDGYRVAIVDIRHGAQAVGLDFGKAYQLIQIHSVGIAPREEFLSNPHWGDLVDLKEGFQIIEGHEIASKVIKFTASNGFIYVPMPRFLPDIPGGLILTIVYRPLREQLETPTDCIDASQKKLISEAEN